MRLDELARQIGNNLAASTRQRLGQSAAEIREDILPRIADVTALQFQVASLELAGEDVSDLKDVLQGRAEMLRAALTIEAADAIVDANRAAVWEVVRAAFSLAL